MGQRSWYLSFVYLFFLNILLENQFCTQIIAIKLSAINRNGHYHANFLFRSLYTAKNVKFSVKDFFSKFWSHFDRIWLYLLKKSFIKNLIFVQCHQLPFAGSVRGFVNAHAHNPCFNLSFSLQNYRRLLNHSIK